MSNIKEQFEQFKEKLNESAEKLSANKKTVDTKIRAIKEQKAQAEKTRDQAIRRNPINEYPVYQLEEAQWRNEALLQAIETEAQSLYETLYTFKQAYDAISPMPNNDAMAYIGKYSLAEQSKLAQSVSQLKIANTQDKSSLSSLKEQKEQLSKGWGIHFQDPMRILENHPTLISPQELALETKIAKLNLAISLRSEQISILTSRITDFQKIVIKPLSTTPLSDAIYAKALQTGIAVANPSSISNYFQRNSSHSQCPSPTSNFFQLHNNATCPASTTGRSLSM